jgi:ubiquinone/menaquinone biosynthesis C-methylase UbiE
MAEIKNNEDKEFNAGERLYLGATKTLPESIKDHFDRYNFAKKYLKPDFIVLDAACGTGYGSEILADSVKKVIGLEINDHALEWGRSHHQKSNIEFKKADLNNPFDLPDNYFDAVVSFETLEHVANQKNLLSEFKRVLRPGGFLIISSPDREIITEKGGANNEFHNNELSKNEFISLLKNYFNTEEIFGQTKYIILPWYKRLIKIIAKLDIFKLRRRIVRILKLDFFFHRRLSPMSYSPIEKSKFDTPNDYFVLLMVCRK